MDGRPKDGCWLQRWEPTHRILFLYNTNDGLLWVSRWWGTRLYHAWLVHFSGLGMAGGGSVMVEGLIGYHEFLWRFFGVMFGIVLVL